MMSGMDSRVDFIEGDLFAPVQNERFDIVLFNPPFLVGVPKDDRDAAWRGRDIPRRFAEQLADHLTPGGMALLMLSTFGDASAAFETELTRKDFHLELVARRRFVNETLCILRVTKASTCGDGS
jgi:release factor glutamine methyltransferase